MGLRKKPKAEAKAKEPVDAAAGQAQSAKRLRKPVTSKESDVARK